ncbi:unnamed protein product [Peronospora belbahrii]|uniref:Uncharacterized protein n=1 Tax=Peronospora belbahrii TaxID=622444 RepID=A0ABN8DC78_9STRA|nr:unnamed protein product [Peronospora belbahrii]
MMEAWNDVKSKAGAVTTEHDTEVERKRISYHDKAKDDCLRLPQLPAKMQTAKQCAAENGIRVGFATMTLRITFSIATRPILCLAWHAIDRTAVFCSTYWSVNECQPQYEESE